MDSPRLSLITNRPRGLRGALLVLVTSTLCYGPDLAGRANAEVRPASRASGQASRPVGSTDVVVGASVYRVPSGNLTLATPEDGGGFTAEGVLPTFRPLTDDDIAHRGGKGLSDRLYLSLSAKDVRGEGDEASNFAAALAASSLYERSRRGCLDVYKAKVRPSSPNSPIGDDDKYVPSCRGEPLYSTGYIRCTPSTSKGAARVNPICSDVLTYRGDTLLLRYSANRIGDWKSIRKFAVCKLDAMRQDAVSSSRARRMSCAL